MLIDIGGGTTEVAVYQKGPIVHTAVVPIGGDHFTNDLAVVLRAPITDAERIKKKYGSRPARRGLRGRDGRGPDGRRTGAEALPADHAVRHPPAAGRGAARVDPRGHQRLGLDKEIRSGIVLTGGGSELEGIVESRREHLRRARAPRDPAGVGGLVDVVSRPEWATATGLLLYGHRYKPARRRAQAFFQRGQLGFTLHPGVSWFAMAAKETGTGEGGKPR